MFGEKVERKNEIEAQTLPTIVTERHPNLFASADTIGPAERTCACVCVISDVMHAKLHVRGCLPTPRYMPGTSDPTQAVFAFDSPK